MPFDYRDIAEADVARIRAELVTAFNNTSAGRETGRHEVSHTDSTVTKAEENERKKTARQFLTDLQRIIEDGKLAAEIVDRVIASKTDGEIADMVSRIEAETGLALQDYAAGILGADDALRRPEESEADYYRRIISAVAAEIIDPATGRIKKQYEDDPLAQIILADEAYRAIMDQVEMINRGEIVADRLVHQFADAGYASAELSAHHVAKDEQKFDLRDGQKNHVDETNESDEIQADAKTFFAKGLAR